MQDAGSTRSVVQAYWHLLADDEYCRLQGDSVRLNWPLSLHLWCEFCGLLMREVTNLLLANIITPCE